MPTLWFILGLSEPVFKAIKKRGYKAPTPIQRKVFEFMHKTY